MINTIDRPCHQYRVGALLVVEMPTLAHDRAWRAYPELGIVGILVGLSEQDRRRALSEALAHLVAIQDGRLDLQQVDEDLVRSADALTVGLDEADAPRARGCSEH
ncbi:hypothetical protein QOZ88_19360 [Blastococcus sp. BMG 814]|uniref:Uncharacterized protein n=1 Tax=Blastococcus carthaginiensis TaxID=3050034 RepID=A0ABT9IHV0_9ACTN|nr:hypothetical protein [Blastococcus carthaginiensis]MDP5184797.1 hypothetical protein [Blastococcus carthaginiensis]